jgi:hypothetical protein
MTKQDKWMNGENHKKNVKLPFKKKIQQCEMRKINNNTIIL